MATYCGKYLKILVHQDHDQTHYDSRMTHRKLRRSCNEFRTADKVKRKLQQTYNQLKAS